MEEKTMRALRILMAIAFLSVFTAYCGSLHQNVTINIDIPTDQPTVDLSHVVAATFESMTQQAKGALHSAATPVATSKPPSPTASAISSTQGSISGDLNYPASSIPAMYVTAYQYGTQNYQFIISTPGQNHFKIDGLTPGVYQVIAYTVGGGGFPAGFAGGYTQALPCGLGASCTDHTLIDVTVKAGQTATGIDPFDWYAPPGTFQAFPQQVQSQPTTSTTPVSNFPKMRTISGTLRYPGSGIPALRIASTATTHPH